KGASPMGTPGSRGDDVPRADPLGGRGARAGARAVPPGRTVLPGGTGWAERRFVRGDRRRKSPRDGRTRRGAGADRTAFSTSPSDTAVSIARHGSRERPRRIPPSRRGTRPGGRAGSPSAVRYAGR